MSEVTDEEPVASVVGYTADRAIDELGPVVTTAATYDLEGDVELTPAVVDTRFHVNYVGDVIEDWEQYRVYPVTPYRQFFGVPYNSTPETEEVIEP